VAENRILKAQIKGRLLLSKEEKATLAEIAHRLGRKALEELACTAQPDTILGWYRKLIANKFDGSRFRQRVGRPRIAEEIERLVVQMAKENPSCLLRAYGPYENENHLELIRIAMARGGEVETPVRGWTFVER
jgi:hypothetical protein